MYRILFFTDPHLKDKEPIGGVDNFNRSKRTVDKINLFSYVIQYAIDYKIDTVACLGDLFDNPSPSERLRTIVSKIFRKAINNGIAVYLLGGNHDTSDNRSYNFMSESALNDKLVFAKQTTIELDKYNILMLSFGQEKEIPNIKVVKPTILAGHFQIIGAKYENERLSESFIAPEELNKFEKVYCGHFHKRQPNYIGALTRNDFGERDNPTGFIVLEIDSNIKETYVSVKDRTFYQEEFEVTSEEEIYNTIDGIDLKDNVIKLKFNLLSDFKPHRNKIRDYAKSKEPFDIIIEYIRENTKICEKIERDLSYQKVFEMYTKISNTPKEYIKKGKEIMEEVFK